MKKLIKFFLLLILILVPVTSVGAHGSDDGTGGKLIFGQNFTLEKGKTMYGDLVVFGGNVMIEEEATITGSIVVFGGTITQDGLVRGDIVVFGGVISVGDKAVVKGDAVTIGGQLNVADGGKIEGERVTNIAPPAITMTDVPKIPEVPRIPAVPSLPSVPSPATIDIGSKPLTNAMNVLFRALAVAALAMLVSVFLQPQIEKVEQTIVTQPLVAGGIGLLTVFVAPLALVLLVVTILLIPVALIGVLLLVLAWLFGIIAMGQEVGERFTKAINQSWAPVLTTGFGTFLLMLVGGAVGIVPCVGWMVPFLIGLVAIGGVMMTWFGSRQPKGPVMNVPAEPLPPAS